MLAVAITLAAGCSGGPEPTQEPTLQDSIGCSAYQQYGDLRGKSVTVYTAILTPEDQSYIDSFKTFESCTGATINYEGSREFEAQLRVKVEAGSSPDIAFVPQPGLLKTLVARFPGQIHEVTGLAAANLDANYHENWRDFASVGDKTYAVPVGASVKSLVWYSPKAFTAQGFEVPTTWEEMMTLTRQIATERPDAKPWCVGLESGTATGWPATDWLEDALLRSAGPEVYDRWVSHEIPFNDPRVVDALDQVGRILKDGDYVNGGLGGVQSVATTSYDEAGLPILDGECFLHHQASFYQSMWPTGTTVANDGDVFAFPLPGRGAEDPPLLVGGEFAVAFSDRPEVRAFQAYLASPEWSNTKARVTPAGWVSANKQLLPENLRSPIDQFALSLLTDDTATFRFDGSDQMPDSVGTGTFWSGMVDWIVFNKPASEVLTEIEESWPSN
ncbi:MAG: ABC transporter substrate-binding protein [Propionibacteriaceae bacterium]|nr:ABC transporter substrate-binding protein [Propionibacteriaceae bacterium]